MKRGSFPFGLAFMLGLCVGVTEAGPVSGTALPECPVMGEPVNLAVSVATDEGPVFFCCEDCVAKYQRNPDKYAGKLPAQREALADRPKVQVTCPVSSEPVDQKVFIEHEGGKTYFCCEGCVKKFRRDPDKYQVALANSYTFQTKCPVMGEDIDPQAFTTTTSGLKIYFCCKGCDKKFLKEPSKYVTKLEAQGFTVKPADVTHVEKEKDGAEPDHGSHDHSGHDHGG